MQLRVGGRGLRSINQAAELGYSEGEVWTTAQAVWFSRLAEAQGEVLHIFVSLGAIGHLSSQNTRVSELEARFKFDMNNDTIIRLESSREGTTRLLNSHNFNEHGMRRERPRRGSRCQVTSSVSA
jgi:hypothetical protein